MFFDRLTLYQTIPSFTTPKENLLENIEGKGENPGNQHCIFSFSHYVLYPSKVKSKRLSDINFVIYKWFQLGAV